MNRFFLYKFEDDKKIFFKVEKMREAVIISKNIISSDKKKTKKLAKFSKLLGLKPNFWTKSEAI